MNPLANFTTLIFFAVVPPRMLGLVDGDSCLWQAAVWGAV